MPTPTPTPNINAKLRELYDYMSADSDNDMGSLDEFNGYMQNEGNRRKLYDYLNSQDENDVGSFNDFSKALGFTNAPAKDKDVRAYEETHQGGGQTTGHSDGGSWLGDAWNTGMGYLKKTGEAIHDAVTPVQQAVVRNANVNGNVGVVSPRGEQQVRKGDGVPSLTSQPSSRAAVSSAHPGDVKAGQAHAAEQKETSGGVTPVISEGNMSKYLSDYASAVDRFIRENGGDTNPIEALQASISSGEGLTSDESKGAVLSLRDNVAKRRADELASSLLGKVALRKNSDGTMEFDPDNTNISSRIRQLYDSREFQNELWKNSQGLQMDYSAFVHSYLKPALDAAMRQRYTQGISTLGTIYENWDDVSRQMESDEMSGVTERYVQPFVDKEFADFDKKRDQYIQKNMPTGAFNDPASPWGLIVTGQANEQNDPDKVADSLMKKAEKIAGGLLNNQEYINEIQRRAAAIGWEPQKYFEEFVAPGMGDALMRRFEQTAVAREMPKDMSEYIISGIEDSVVGMLINMFMRTPGQRKYREQAIAMTAEGNNPNVDKPGLLAEGSRLASTMASDFWLWGGWGKIGGAAAMDILSERALALSAKTGIGKAAAMRLIGEEAKHNLSKDILNNIISHVTSSAITMGGAEMTSEFVKGVSEGKSLAENIIDTVAGAPGHLATGAAFGVTGGFVNPIVARMSGVYKLAGKAAGFGLEAFTMNATERVQQGETPFSLDGLPESMVKLLFIKASANPAHTAARFVRAVTDPVGTVKDAMKPDSGVFTKEEADELMSWTEGSDLIDALSNMRPPRTKTGADRQGAVDAETVARSEEAYLKLMNNPDVPFTLKAKVATMLDGVAPAPGLEVSTETRTNDDGSVTVYTRDIDGQCIRREEYDSMEAASEALGEMSFDLDWNETESLEKRHGVFFALADFDRYLYDRYQKAVLKRDRGEQLSKNEEDDIYLYLNKGDVERIRMKMSSGKPLSNDEQEMLNLYSVRLKNHASSQSTDIFRRNYEKMNNLEEGSLDDALNGHTKMVAEGMQGEEFSRTGEREDIVEVGHGTWRTAEEQRMVEDYRDMLRIPTRESDIEDASADNVVDVGNGDGDVSPFTEQAQQPAGEPAGTVAGNKTGTVAGNKTGTEAMQRGYDADDAGRVDIAMSVINNPDSAEAQDQWEGVRLRIREEMRAEANSQINELPEIRHTDGQYYLATLKQKNDEGEDVQVYIVDGNVSMDGSVVDGEKSDSTVVIFNPATGERKMIDPVSDFGIATVDQISHEDDMIDGIIESREQNIEARLNEIMAAAQERINSGDMPANNEEQQEGAAMPSRGTEEGEPVGEPTGTVAGNKTGTVAGEPTVAMVEGAPEDYTTDMELTIRNDDGSETLALVMGRVRAVHENGRMDYVPDADGNLIEYLMDGVDHHENEAKLASKVVSYVPAQSAQETAPEAHAVQEESNIAEPVIGTSAQESNISEPPTETPVTTPTEPQPTEQITGQPATEPMPVREDGEEDWQATTPERAHAYIFNEAGLSRSEGNEFIAANIDAANKALVKAKSAQMPRVGTSIKKYNEAKAKRQEKIDEAQRTLDYWNGVRDIQNAIQREENERRAAEDAVRHDEAVAEAQADYEARKQAEAERKAVGNENPMPAITEKWNNATKVDGHRDEIMLPDGTPLKGHYVLHESGASSPSHNPETWQKTDGFPMDANDNSVNDRDYERDHDAQEHTQSIARQYDQRALQSVPVVSNDGVVLSGNGRTMAGELAARDNTDGAYVNYLKEYASKFGFTPEQVEAMQHPRVSFVPDEAMPYTAETFAKFNQQEMKSQNKTEQAVKLGKTVSDDSFKGIVRTINGYDTLGDFYNDAEASLGAVYDLHNAGVVPQAQLAEMVDGIRGQERLSAVGREFLENMLIGKAFEGDPDVVRMLTAEPAMRQTVITALGEIADNIALGDGWSLQGELADAVKLCFDARQDGAKYGDIVSIHARQGVLFADPDELQTVADFNNATMLILADVLNDKRVTLLKTTLQLYNNNARQSASGQTDLFAGGIQSREDILSNVINYIKENYGKRKEIEAARAEAVERRKAESVVPGDKPGGTRSSSSELGSTLVGTGIQQDGTPPAVSGGSEDAGGNPDDRHRDSQLGSGRQGALETSVTDEERTAMQARIVDWLSDENLTAALGKSRTEIFDLFGNAFEPIAYIPSQYLPLISKDIKDPRIYCGMGYFIDHALRNHGLDGTQASIEDVDVSKYLNIQAVLDNPDAIKETYVDGKRTVVFVKKIGRYFAELTQVEEDGKIILHKSLFSQKKEPYAKLNDIRSENSSSEGGTSSISHAAEATPAISLQSRGDDMSDTSEGKGSDNSATVQEKTEKVAENQSPIQGLDGYTEDEVLSLVRGDIEEKLADAGIDGVTLKGMALHGSRLRGDASEDSDLDVVVEYEGNMSEDGLFNILNDEPMEIEGVRVDVNPITSGKSGTLDQYMERSRQFDALKKAERETDTEPTEAQKEAGNYKKGHVKIDGYDVTIENPKGSVRRGTDAGGKQWEQEMQNTYGYIRGTEGVDGDHIDVFFSDDPSQGDVFVVDQVNKDGSFDEHKVMYGFPDIESARKAYLSNYEDGWQGLGAITPVSKEEFKKWIDSSHRKTKPFAEYSSVKTLGDTHPDNVAIPSQRTEEAEQQPKVEIKTGEDYVSAAERIAKEQEIKATAAHFPMETTDEASAFDKGVSGMSDAELLMYMREDGKGDVNKSHHPSVYDEYDYRHGDEQLQSYDDTLVRLNESGTTLEQAEEMLANIQKDVSRLATEDRAMLLGQEEALQEYIAGLEKIVPGHDLQEHIDTLAALQDNGKDYNKNAYDAYAAGRRFGNGVNKELTKKEAIALAHKMVDENYARGGVYILPFLDGVGDSVDLRSGKISDEAGTQKKEYVDKKNGVNDASSVDKRIKESKARVSRVSSMSDEELLRHMSEGIGQEPTAFYEDVFQEYDSRHADEELSSYNSYLDQLRNDGTTLEEAGEMLAGIEGDEARLATAERPRLLGQEEALRAYIEETEDRDAGSAAHPGKRFVNEQGNPVDADGNLILEEISSVDELKGEDFSNPTRNVQLPKIPERVDKAIGAGGKPLIIKKNIFEKNARDHRDLKPSQSREILKTALYTPDLYGQNQQVSRPYNYVVISTKGADGKNKLVLLEVNNGKENVEIVHWHYIRDKALETLKRQAEREGGHILILPSDNSKEAGGLSSRTLDLSSTGKGSDLFGNAQGKGKKSSPDAKIDDVGEVLAGARKDMRKEIAKSLANVTEADLIEKPFGKVYKKPDLKKAVESGALREKDAIFYEALFSTVNQQKPKVTQSEMRSKRYIPDFKTKAERWAAYTFKQIEVLRHFMELDEPGRDAMMERMLADRYPTREQELAEIEKRKGWNPDYEGHKYEWGEMTTPNPLWVTHEVMNRLGYSVGDKLDVPYGVVKANTSGTGYSIENLKGERHYTFGSKMTLDEAIDRVVYLAKLKRGDADVSHPTQLFTFPATKSESGESGRYRVMWGRDYKTREFDSKDEADAFAQTKNGAYVSPIMETKRKFGYKVRFTHPLTGEKMFVDDTEFDTKGEAQAYFDGNFEKINDSTNTMLQKEREKKGEKKTLTADDVVHVTMVHPFEGGWTHAVVIDKKYANNDGQVRIIKEGFASRKDAKSFADSVKDAVLKTVLKHKEDAKKIVYFDTGENSRIGEDYRNGKNVDAEDFMNTFGFRGVQFGNWTNQADRQMAVNQAYDAFMDMARLIGVSPKAMSLNGELGIAFGARGVGGFAAHYEPGEVVINLTKTQGAGSLAHEWWHALDNYFARRAGSAGDMVTDNRRIEMRDALRKAFNDMLDLVKGSDYVQRSVAKGEYWGRTHEITARLLAEWVDRELKKRGELNTFLSRGAVVERGQQHNYDVYEVLERLAGREPMPFEEYKELPESLKGIPYPSAKEVEQFGGSLLHIFDTLEEKVDEETGNVMLYEPTATYETRDGGKVVCRSLFDEMGVRSIDEAAMVSQHTQQGQGQNQVIAPSEIRLRKLKKGETCHVERVYEETKQFDFTGKEKVESAEDVAYIFRQLENAAVENSFLVLVKDGRPTVIHLGVGSYVTVMAPYEQAFVAYRELKPEQVYFVHNHPSGVLKASRQDQELLKRVKMAFGPNIVQPGIIIDTTSGKYGEFDMVADNYNLVQTSGVEAMPQSEGADVPLKVYQFSRQVFAPDWNPESAFKIVSSLSVAEFVSSHRLGEHKKMSFLVVNNSGNVVANVFLPWTKLSDIKRSKDAGDLLAGYVHQCGGVRGVLYGNYDYEPDDKVVLAAVGGRMRQLNAPLMDALHVEHSALESGWSGVGEPGGGYGVKELEEVNTRFNEELQMQIEGTLPKGHVYDMGMPGDVLLSTGVANVPIELTAQRLRDKSYGFGHDYDLSELKDLVKAINHPIAVFRYGDKSKAQNIVVEIEHEGKNFIVGLSIRPNVNGGVLEINSIRNVFPKDNAEWLNWINQGKLLYADKEKIQTLIDQQRTNLADVAYLDLNSVAKLVKDFENPSIDGVKNSKDTASYRIVDDPELLNELEDGEWEEAEYVTDKMIADMNEKAKRGMPQTPEAKRTEAERLAMKFNTPINIIEDVNEITHPNAEIQEQRRRAKGWYDKVTRQVYVVLPNNRNVEDVAATVFHETVGHKGLRELIGDGNYNDFLREVYEHLKVAVRRRIVKLAEKHNWDFEKATDEYLSRLAEKGFEDFDREERSVWQWLKEKVVNAINKFLQSLKLPKWVKLGDNELRYILWRSKERMERGREDYVDRARDIVKREELGLTDEDTDLYRDPDETEDIWNDQSMGLKERITAASIRLADRHRDNKTLRNDAMRAISDNLADLRKAMSLQRQFDMTTVKRVADLVRVLMNGGYISGATQQEVKRLLAAVKNSVGHNDIESSVQKVMDIMVDNRLKHAEEALRTLERTKATKVDAKGVVVGGTLDPAGAQVLKVFKQARQWRSEDIDAAIADATERMGSDDNSVADDAALDYAGLLLAKDYDDTIRGSKAEEAELRAELREARASVSDRDRLSDAYRERIASIEEAIRQNKIERAQAYFDLVSRMTDGMRESAANAKAFKEAEKQRISEIHHNANSDMEGVPSNEHYNPSWLDKFANNGFVQFFFNPLSTFEQFMRLFGSKSANGEGYLYNRFVRGWTDARQKELRGVDEKFGILDAKVNDIFGGKVKSMGDLIRYVGKLPKVDVSFWDGGEMRDHTLGQGELMYIYMVNKMLDGRMKLRKMGITEEDVSHIEDILDPRLKDFADWVQDSFLVDTRNEYNETHKRMFGASMSAIEDYFPLKILGNARADKEEDLDRHDWGEGITTATSAIKKRRRNALALDLLNANALNVLLNHVAEMEHWNAFAEFNRDINTLRTYKRFRNQVQNMTTIYGSGKELWKRFNEYCQMAAGSYRPPVARADKAAVNIAKGATASCVSMRVFTAFKQFLSFPAYFSDAACHHLLKGIVTPWESWMWGMEHLPIFRERWKSRISGDPRLLKSDMDWKMWRSRITQLAARVGMTPNAFVDALTVSIGAHAIYKTRYAQYKKDGYSDDQAERKAIQDAEIGYNLTQQSSEGIFLSTMQVDRSWMSVLLTIFRNASMSYQRQLHDALRNMKRNLTPGQRTKSIEFMKKQLVRDGLSDEQASAAAKRRYNRQLRRDSRRLAVFGCLLQFAWNMGAYLPYLLFGDDDDKKKTLLKDIFTHTIFGSLEGLSAGDVLSTAGNMLFSDEPKAEYLKKEMPMMSNLYDMVKKFFGGEEAEALTDLINLIVMSGIGINPQTITDAVVAIDDACNGDLGLGKEDGLMLMRIDDACNGDLGLGKEVGLMLMRIMQMPQSQLDELYIDELGMSARDARKLSVGQLAKRYAEYKRKKGAPVFGLLQGEEGRMAAEKRYEDRFNNKLKERIGLLPDEALEWNFNTDDNDLRKEIGKEYAKRHGAEDTYGSVKSPGGQVYASIRDYVDLAEDIQLQQAQLQAEAAGDTERAKEISKARTKISNIKKDFTDGSGSRQDVLDKIRKERRSAINEYCK